MSEKTKPKVLIIEDIKTSRESAKQTLESSGWEVICENTTEKALQTLENFKKSPFALIISGVRMPDMDGDEILIKAGEISPVTQRMVIIPVEEKEILIRSINMANIHACIFYPFKEEDLISESKLCNRAFLSTMKRHRFKRLVKRQNKQLYETAQKFKKKDVKNRQRIKEKQSRILQLKSRMRKQNREDFTNLSLERYVEHKKLARQSSLFLREFEIISANIRSLIKQNADKHSHEWEAQNLNEIISSMPEKFEPHELIENLTTMALINCLDIKNDTSDTPEGADLNIDENTFEHYLEFIVSDDYIQAWLQKKREVDKEIVNLASILDFLKDSQISYGIIDDETIEEWLDKPYNKDDKIVIAKGKECKLGKEGKITYNFKIDYSNPGRIREDGSIDFRERGKVPFVKKGDLLASLQPSVEGIVGVNLAGSQIPVDEIIDPIFSSESGTILSEDTLSIIADADGQPHVDAMGNVTVNEELVINDDVDFKTGNIHFEGNIIVKGIIKEGFMVKGISLTAREIEGATIELSGDLNVSDGITNANIKTVGNIYTRFINNCRIYGFGDFIVQKEIIDSSMWLSGSCQVPTGHIIASSISAKQGIEAKNIGTHSSKPPVLRVGLDDHIDKLDAQIQAELDESLSQRDEFKTHIKKLNKKDRNLHKKISENAYIQDRSQIEIKEHKKQLAEHKAIKNSESVQKTTQAVFELKKNSDLAKSELNRLFELQDSLGIKIDDLTDKVHIQEEKNISFMAEKKHLQTIREKNTPDPKISVAQTIVQGAKIKGPNTSLILSQDRSRCIIQEEKKEEDVLQYFEMTINDL
ncbi:MAG: DUF342 domain-containing protein [Desulfobacula sp.]|nr:DUF342 domain-containing protein [Desulfobacula sp.]